MQWMRPQCSEIRWVTGCAPKLGRADRGLPDQVGCWPGRWPCWVVRRGLRLCPADGRAWGCYLACCRLGPQAVLCNWAGSDWTAFLGDSTRHAQQPGKALGWALLWGGVGALQAGLQAGYCHRLRSETAQGHCSGSLIMWGRGCWALWSGFLSRWPWRLHSAAGQGCRTSFPESKACWLGAQIRKNFHPSSLARWA